MKQTCKAHPYGAEQAEGILGQNKEEVKEGCAT